MILRMHAHLRKNEKSMLSMLLHLDNIEDSEGKYGDNSATVPLLSVFWIVCFFMTALCQHIYFFHLCSIDYFQDMSEVHQDISSK